MEGAESSADDRDTEVLMSSDDEEAPATSIFNAPRDATGASDNSFASPSGEQQRQQSEHPSVDETNSTPSVVLAPSLDPAALTNELAQLPRFSVAKSQLVSCISDHLIGDDHPLREICWQDHYARRQYTKCTSLACRHLQEFPDSKCPAKYRMTTCTVTSVTELARIGEHLGSGAKDGPEPKVIHIDSKEHAV